MLIGVFAGLLVVLFHITIDTMQWSTIGAGVESSPLYTLLVPMLAPRLRTLLVRYIVPSARGNGVNLTKAALYANDGEIPASTVAGKFAVCTLSIGSGNSLGPEDPALQMGAGVASFLGRMFGCPSATCACSLPSAPRRAWPRRSTRRSWPCCSSWRKWLGAWNAGVSGLHRAGRRFRRGGGSDVSRRRAAIPRPALHADPPSELILYAIMGVVGGLLAAVFVGGVTGIRTGCRRAPI